MNRSLLIDNYDSYTYNLFQLMAQVNGVEPVVVSNDDPRCVELALELGCVVISPGPGDPRNEADFGRCADVLALADIPVLGVCLGHQGLAAVSGGRVERAPAPRHGHVSKIRHTNDELFRGIPQEFRGVRYHSLCALEPVPDGLEPIAWAEDGVLMAVRHRDRPHWGVQFHPESVLTEYGAHLMWNFRRIVERHQRSTTTGGPAAERLRYTAHMRSMACPVDTESIYHEVFAAARHSIWLDSARRGQGLARFSYLAEASPVHGEVLTYRVAEGEVAVERVGADTQRVPGSIFEVLDRELRRRSVTAPELPFDFIGGYMGYFGYELKADCGATAKHTSEVQDAVWMFPDRFAVVDHADDTLHLVALSTGDEEAEKAAQHWLERTAAAVQEAADRPTSTVADDPNLDADAAELRGWAEAGLVRDRERYLADIQRCKDELYAGESYEICLTNAVRLARTEDPLAFYRRLRRRNPAPYGAYISAGGVQIACSSPERFLKIDRGGVVESKPIKGTAPRGRTPEEDERLRSALASDAKSRAENLMIVDLLRNDLGRVCEPATLYVPVLMQVESYETVHQLVSTIRGRLRAGASAVDCVRACFPGGSMTGAPKLRTMEIIDELETEARGPYSGSIGFIGCNGTADLNITIRTAVLTENGVWIGAGGAIVVDSDPDAEYEEMILKARAPMLGLAAPELNPTTALRSAAGTPETPVEVGQR